MSVPHARGFLLVRRAGGVWGIANAAVDGLARARGRSTGIAVGGEALAADEIAGGGGGSAGAPRGRGAAAVLARGGGGDGGARRRCRWWWWTRGSCPRRCGLPKNVTKERDGR